MRFHLLILLVFALFACANNKSENKEIRTDTSVTKAEDIPSNKTDTNSTSNTEPGVNLVDESRKLVQLIKDGNFAEISKYVSPTSGLGFSTNSHINEEDMNFTKSQVAKLWTDPKKYVFPDYSDEPPKITFREYYKYNVYDKDFVKAENLELNKMQRGPSSDLFTITQTYPTASFVDFYIPAPKEEELNWATLRLVFLKEKGNWYLRHIVHDNWTP